MRLWKNGAATRGATITMLAALLTAGCATNRVSDPRDPLERYNRGVYRFNDDFDKAFLRPVAKAYKAVTPEALNRGITNFFANIEDVTSMANNVLQFKMSHAASDLGRLLVNTSLGFLGFMDVATNLGLPSYKEDFGQTLGYWGMPPGAYFMLPILGPSSIRDTLGWAGDIVMDPFFSIDAGEVYWGFVALRTVDFRADRLGAGEILEDAAPDPYVFLRDAYLQRRRNLVYDGNPPESEDESDIWAGVQFERTNSSPAKGAVPRPASRSADTPLGSH
jgi:phospholipid-binding lipoprotein MlaA